MVAYLFYHWTSQTERNIEESIIEAKPTFIAVDFTSYTYNSDGYLYQVVNAEKAEFYKNVDMMNLEKPNVEYMPYFDKENIDFRENMSIIETEVWRIGAESGTINNDDNFILRGDVRVTNSNEEAYIHEISSEYMELDFNTNDIRTPERITITGPNFLDTGIGFSGNIKEQKYSINEDCHAEYSGPFKK
jgi:LPS export ABC transporter protein LptC